MTRSEGEANVHVSDPVLDIRGLHVVYRSAGAEVAALADFNLRLGQGDTVGLVGESGCGKSTVALAILGLLGPAGKIVAGSIRFHGQELVSAAPRRLRSIRGRRIAMIFQEPMAALNPVFTIGTQISEAIRLHRGAARRQTRDLTLQIMADVQIPEPHRIARAYPHQLSGGLRQRAMIAIVLVGQSDLLIVDEPTTALDVTIQAQILDVLVQLQADRAMSLILISHDLRLVAETTGRIAVMYGGMVVEEQPTPLLMAAPVHPYSRALLRSLPRLDQPQAASLPRLDQAGWSARPVTSGCPYQLHCDMVQPRCRTAGITEQHIVSGGIVRCVHPEINKGAR